MPATPVALILAQDGPPPASPGDGGGGGGGGGGGSFLTSLPLLVIIFVIFYVLMIRPQSKERKKREEMVRQIKKGDRVVTTAGIHGEVVGTAEGTVTLRVDDGVRIVFDRQAIWQVKTVAAPDAPETPSKEKEKA